LGQSITDELAAGGTFAVISLTSAEIDARLHDGTVDGVVVLPAGFSARLLSRQDRRISIDLRLEGSNPTRSRLVAARVAEAATKAMVGLLSGGTGVLWSAGRAAGGHQCRLPLCRRVLDAMDYVAPVYIAFLSFFFVFLLTCVAFLRERSQGTMERLLATPATGWRSSWATWRPGAGGADPGAVILSFTIWALRIHYLGSLTLLFVIVALLALVGVGLGILASTFARQRVPVAPVSSPSSSSPKVC